MITGLAPGIYLSGVLGLLYGALAHLLWGRHWLHLPLFVIGGVLGCLLVWGTGLHLFTALPAPGGLPIPEATAVAWLLLAAIAALRRA
ncbi:hypothetical protein [Kallotenue papyrolyticum]|uniref:hypothetical protein n=1 Tax=Kallotenue papyrolyticum TaxID=1325125 RepID=UPI00047863FC|nr:hypothetical protein [Kallotenue papyrolyticum]